MVEYLNVLVDEIDWASGKDEHYVAKAEFDFVSDAPDELSFKNGQRLVIAPKGKFL